MRAFWGCYLRVGRQNVAVHGAADHAFKPSRFQATTIVASSHRATVDSRQMKHSLLGDFARTLQKAIGSPAQRCFPDLAFLLTGFFFVGFFLDAGFTDAGFTIAGILAAAGVGSSTPWEPVRCS